MASTIGTLRTLTERVISSYRVIDGDSVMVTVKKNRVVRRLNFRLTGLDCPERGQRDFENCKRALQHLLDSLSRPVLALTEPHKTGRAYGLIHEAGIVDPSQSINAWMVRAGWAHAYRTYYALPGVDELQQEAREARRGIWRHSTPPRSPEAARKAWRPPYSRRGRRY